MDVILVKDVERLGRVGQRRTVKDGYARNFLLPKGLALRATASALQEMKNIQAAQARQSEAARQKARELGQRLSAISLTIPVSVGDQGKLHGVVTARDILEALKKEGIVLEKNEVNLPKPIAQLGVTAVSIELHPEVSVTLPVSVVRR